MEDNMVGIVLVSHSVKIVEGTIELCQQMAQSEIKLINAGGTADGRIGTDTTKIMSAIEDANTGDGVVLIADIGSSVKSTQMALEFLDEEIREKIILADTPFVEGSIAAVVEASLGHDLKKVVKAAEQAKNYSKK
jgi:dihydroxyacetone kinase phosphotransfer subunit